MFDRYFTHQYAMKRTQQPGPAAARNYVCVFMSFVLVLAIGCQSEPIIPIPSELTPGMSILLNEDVDSSLKSGLFTDMTIPSGFPFGIGGALTYVYRDSSDGIEKTCELYLKDCDRVVSSVYLSWKWDKEAYPNPSMDSRPDKVLSFLRARYKNRLTISALDSQWFNGTWVVDQNLKLSISLITRENSHYLGVHFYPAE